MGEGEDVCEEQEKKGHGCQLFALWHYLPPFWVEVIGVGFGGVSSHALIAMHLP